MEEETITYKVVVCDFQTNNVYILNIDFPYYSPDDYESYEIIEKNEKVVETYIYKELRLNPDFTTFVIFSDEGKSEVYGNDNKHIATIP